MEAFSKSKEDRGKNHRDLNWKTVIAIIASTLVILGFFAAYTPKSLLSSFILWWGVVKSITLILLIMLIAVLSFWILMLKRSLKTKLIIRRASPIRTFNSLMDASSLLRDIILKFSETVGTKEIKVLGATGASFLTIVKEYLENPVRIKNIHFKLLLINPEFQEIDKCSSHWKSEVVSVIEELNQLQKHLKKIDNNLHLDWKLYNYLPALHGIMLEDTDLLMGFFYWTEKGDKYALRGAEKPYIYLRKDDIDSSIYFNLFSSWFRYNWEQE